MSAENGKHWAPSDAVGHRLQSRQVGPQNCKLLVGVADVDKDLTNIVVVVIKLPRSLARV